MADVSKIKLPNGTTYDIKDDNALPLTGGTVTGSLAVKNGQSDVQFMTIGGSTYSYVEVVFGGRTLRLVSNANGNIGLYDPDNSKWVIRADTNGAVYASGTDLTIPTSGAAVLTRDLIVGGHSSAIGTIITSCLESAMELGNNTPKALCSITLPAGTWMLIGYVRFPANNNGVRRLNFAETADVNYIHQQAQPAQGAITQMQVTFVTTSTAETTWYLNAQQTSGSALTMPAGTVEGYTNGIRAVRIA